VQSAGGVFVPCQILKQTQSLDINVQKFCGSIFSHFDHHIDAHELHDIQLQQALHYGIMC